MIREEMKLTDFAQMILLSPERVRQLVVRGDIPRGSRGYVPFPAALHAYLQVCESQIRRAEERAKGDRLSNAKVALLRLRIEEKRRTTIPKDEVVFLLRLILRILRQEMKLVSKDPCFDRQLRNAIEDRIAGVLNRAEERIGKFEETGEIDRP